MKILYFSRDYTPHDFRFLSAIAQREREVYFLRLERGARQVENRTLPDNVHQIHWRGAHLGDYTAQSLFNWHKLPALWADLRRVIREIQPDVIHAGPLPTVAFLAALSGFRPLVSMSWGYDLLQDVERSTWQKRTARYALKRSAILLGDCQAVQQKAVTLGFPPEKVILFPWGVDLQHFSPAPGPSPLRERLGWHAQRTFVLLCLRSWEPLYGVDIVVRAFASAAAELPELRLLLLGNGSQAATIKKILIQHNLLDRVHFGGQVNNTALPGYYHAADLYLSASHTDGSSVSLLEAMGCGLPSLVSDIPGNREWIHPGDNGWLFPDGDEAALASKIIAAARNRSQLTPMGQATRRTAEEHADWQKNTHKLWEAYDRATS
ncbi:MAG TPA: glycosyltransferase family 4 protein [Anaerolineaceae bacterium]|nr:glycosyltransferase family 4 protein [Anaerolineaceae bacterium]